MATVDRCSAFRNIASMGLDGIFKQQVSASFSKFQQVMVDKPSDPQAFSVTCANCEACCCQLQVLLISDTGVPEGFVVEDDQGTRSMARLDDGWCSALDRNTMRCMIYLQRPLVCREFEMGSYDCISERHGWGLAVGSES